MDHEIQLISDGDGLAVIGDPNDVERFLVSEGLASHELDLRRTAVLRTGAGLAQAGSTVAAESGRWVKLTKESAEAIRKYGLSTNSKSGLSTGVVRGNKGQIKGFVEFVKTPRAFLTNPAVLAGAAGVMAQLAMQQTMDEITDYLATIDEKVDDVLRAQKDSVLARMIGVGFVIEEAMTIREHGGRVNQVTWSKVQGTPATIAEVQAYALRQLDALAEKVESKTEIGDLAKAAKEADARVPEWLAVLARCFQLQEAIAVLELDRVLDASPDELEGHRFGLKAARKDRLELITRITERLLERIDAAGDTANTKVLMHPGRAPAVVRSSNRISVAIAEFHGRLGIEGSRESLEARRWADAAIEARSKVLEAGTDGFEAARHLGSQSLDRARSATDKLPERIAARRLRWRRDDEQA